MLLAHLAAVVFFSFTFIIRTSHDSTSLGLFLSWTKLSQSPLPTFNSIYSDLYSAWFPSVIESSHCSDPLHHELFQAPSNSVSGPVCFNHLEIITKLVPEISCSIHDRFESVPPQLYEIPLVSSPPTGELVKQLQNLSLCLADKFRPLEGWRLVSIVPLCCGIMCAIVFVGYRCNRVSDEKLNNSITGEAKEPNFHVSPSDEKELLPIISRIVFEDPAPISLSYPEQKIEGTDDKILVDSCGSVNKPERLSLPLSQSPAAATFTTSLDICRNLDSCECRGSLGLDLPKRSEVEGPMLRSSTPILAVSGEFLLTFPDTCYDQDTLELSSLPEIMSAVAAIPQNSSACSPVPSSITSPLSSVRSSLTSSPPTSPASSPTLSPSTITAYGEGRVKDSFEYISTHNASSEDIQLNEESAPSVQGMEVQSDIIVSSALDLPATAVHVPEFGDSVDRRIPVDLEFVFGGEAKRCDVVHETTNYGEGPTDRFTTLDTQASALEEQKSLKPVSSIINGESPDPDVSSFDSPGRNISWADDIDEMLSDSTCGLLLAGGVSGIAIDNERYVANMPDFSKYSYAPDSPIKHTETYHPCCELVAHDIAPKSWDTYEWPPCWTSRSRFRPRDSDSALKSTRFAVDNIDFMKCSGVRPNIRFTYQPLETALAQFNPSKVDCFNPRLDGTAHLTAFCYGVVDFESVEQASRAFRNLQGRRIAESEPHWRLEFLDPEDETRGGRRFFEKPPQSRRRRVLKQGVGIGERRRPGSDIRAVLTATQAHNSSGRTWN